MASKRARRRRTCLSKIAYGTLAEAATAARAYVKRHGGIVSWYECKSCGKFHVGHTPWRLRQSLRDRRRNREARAGDEAPPSND